MDPPPPNVHTSALFQAVSPLLSFAAWRLFRGGCGALLVGGFLFLCRAVAQRSRLPACSSLGTSGKKCRARPDAQLRHAAYPYHILT